MIATAKKAKGSKVAGRVSAVPPQKLPPIANRSTSRGEDNANNTTERKVSTDKTTVAHFVYSEAVEATFRNKFLSSAFGPRPFNPENRAPPLPPVEPFGINFEISRASELYRDFLFVRRNLESNRRHIAKLKRDEPQMHVTDEATRPTLKLPRLSMRNAITLAKFRNKLNKKSSPEDKTASPNESSVMLPALPEKQNIIAN
jgi:hypothetical protein